MKKMICLIGIAALVSASCGNNHTSQKETASDMPLDYKGTQISCIDSNTFERVFTFIDTNGSSVSSPMTRPDTAGLSPEEKVTILPWGVIKGKQLNYTMFSQAMYQIVALRNPDSSRYIAAWCFRDGTPRAEKDNFYAVVIYPDAVCIDGNIEAQIARKDIDDFLRKIP